MKATIDVPDEIYREVKARGAREGRTVREITISLYSQWLGKNKADTEDEEKTRRDEKRKQIESLSGIWKGRGSTDELMRITRGED